MANTMIYQLKDFTDITFDGFNFSLPEETIQIISSLSLEVGSPSYIKTPVFRKRENPLKSTLIATDSIPDYFANNGNNSNNSNFKRKRGNKNMEIINDDEWEALRNFQTTKIEKKEGIESNIDIIRSYLNKITDKNYADMKNKIVEILNQMDSEDTNNEEISRISSIIFEIASTNRFYSKIYADLYSELIQQFEPMRFIFQKSFDSFMDLFQTIEYVDPSVDYDKFCKINKTNEKRKALSTFFINLMMNKMISKEKIIHIIQHLLLQIYTFISVEDKKNEVDELTENVVLLFKKELFTEKDCEMKVIANMNITELIEFFANCKVKDFKSLTNKSIFKFMDMIDM
jgi:hypothetical protein